MGHGGHSHCGVCREDTLVEDLTRGVVLPRVKLPKQDALQRLICRHRGLGDL
jgi:hypothetical protein